MDQGTTIDENYGTETLILKIIVVPTGLLIAILIAIGLLAPTPLVQRGSELSEADLRSLIDNRIIAAHDQIDYFYSDCCFSILDSGNLLVQDRVISYHTADNDEIVVAELYFGEIADVTMESQGEFFSDSIYTVNTDDPQRSLTLLLSSEQAGDRRFVDALRRRVSEAAGDRKLVDALREQASGEASDRKFVDAPRQSAFQ